MLNTRLFLNISLKQLAKAYGKEPPPPVETSWQCLVTCTRDAQGAPLLTAVYDVTQPPPTAAGLKMLLLYNRAAHTMGTALGVSEPRA